MEGPARGKIDLIDEVVRRRGCPAGGVGKSGAFAAGENGVFVGRVCPQKEQSNANAGGLRRRRRDIVLSKSRSQKMDGFSQSSAKAEHSWWLQVAPLWPKSVAAKFIPVHPSLGGVHPAMREDIDL